ncbi:MAG: DUF427 domain-containing protein [Gammaproteobacteria bacterium]|nr:DUF427 domain-containing protein [Gammaproteobacteria bacterium]
MPQARWNGTVIAESAHCEMVEGNHYFPPAALKRDFVQASDTHTVCGWKGKASYYDVVVNGQVNRDACWYYPDCKPDAKHIEGYVAFWRGVEISA